MCLWSVSEILCCPTYLAALLTFIRYLTRLARQQTSGCLGLINDLWRSMMLGLASDIQQWQGL